MERIFAITKALSSYFYWIAGAALVCLMLLTVSDVILRVFGRPITGIYDITELLGGIIIGFAIPFAGWKKVHVYVEFLRAKVSLRFEKVLKTISSCLGIFLFLLLGWNLILHGINLHKAGEVSKTIKLPLSPVIVGIGVSCFINSLVILYQLVKFFHKEKKA
jgi:TRAP-type C4-dicarboxylate transport system permease small subunit